MNALNLTVGYVPPSFPRDSIDVNQYDEHIILGQILEPLLEADDEGQIRPSIAKQWHFSKSGLQISFILNEGIKFSDGQFVKAKDVVYSIERHMNSSSQSKGFLSSIKSISAESESEVLVKLKSPNIAVVKALTRDQLGIVPYGWKFDKTSDSPYVGTGPYNLIRENGKWLLKKKIDFTRFPVPINQWEIIFYKDDKFTPAEIIPDLIPSITSSILDKLRDNRRLQKEIYKIETRLGYNQMNFWVYPKGSLYGSREKRILAQSFLNELIEDHCEKKNYLRSTGMVPMGIQGSLNKMPEIKKYKRSQELKTLKLASRSGAFNAYLDAKKVKEIKLNYGIDVEHKSFSPMENDKMAEWRPDIVVGSWAGGFSDPLGFLGILNIILGMNFKDFLKELAHNLTSAEIEQDWTKRADLFRKIGEAVVAEGLMVPGWRIPMFEVMSHKIEKKEFQTRYTPRFVNFKSVD